MHTRIPSGHRLSLIAVLLQIGIAGCGDASIELSVYTLGAIGANSHLAGMTEQSRTSPSSIQKQPPTNQPLALAHGRFCSASMARFSSPEESPATEKISRVQSSTIHGQGCLLPLGAWARRAEDSRTERPTSRAWSCINRNSQTALMGHKLRSAVLPASTNIMLADRR